MKKYATKLLVMLMLISIFSIIGQVNQKSIVFAQIPSGSDLIVTEAGGVKTVEAYDDFNDYSLDNQVWEYSGDYSEYYGRLGSKGDVGLLELKGDYSDFDTYHISIDLVDLSNQHYQRHNGGIGISNNDQIWSFSQIMYRPYNNNSYYRAFNIVEYGSINSQNRNGNQLTNSRRLESNKRWGWNWAENDVRIVMDINEIPDNEYAVKVSFYAKKSNGRWPNKPNKILNYEIDKNELDFKTIYLTSIEPVRYWINYMDNFYFKATKVTKVDMLKASWDDGTYKLSWDEIEGANQYNVYYLEGTSRNKITTIPASDTRIAFVDDSSINSKKAYTVEAEVDDGTIVSNTVYLGGRVTSPFTINGSFTDYDYDVSWTALNLEDDPTITYTLMYGESDMAIDKIVEGAENLSSDQLTYKILSIQNSDKYYGKYIRTVANVDYDSYGITKYFTDKLQILSDVKLNISHVDKYYIFNWIYRGAYRNYQLYKSDLKSDLEDKNNLPSGSEGFVQADAINGEIIHKVSDTDPSYSDKYYLLEGRHSGAFDYSAILKIDTNVKTPNLSWSIDTLGNRVFSWTEMPGASKVELYYGSKADAITINSGATDLLSTHKFETVEDDFEDVYVQVRFLKDDIWYYSNIVKTSTIEFVQSELVEEMSEESETNKYKLVLDWQDVEWIEDNGDSGRISYYRIYYIDDADNEVELQTNLLDSQYIIEDIYDSNSIYLGKEIYVEAVCPVQDTFNIDYKMKVKSSPMIPRKLEFDSLEGNYINDAYLLSWAKPLEMDVANQTLLVSSYALNYGDSKSIITSSLRTFSPPFTTLEEEILNIKGDGDDGIYYHKFFEVKAVVDNISYRSNNQYSGDDFEMNVLRFSDDFTLKWNRIDNADEIKIYHAEADGDSEPSDEDYEIYESAHLAGTAKQHTIEDLDDTKKEYNNHYFKVEAVFGDDAYHSNAVQIDVTKSLPVLEGQYQVGGSYDFSWTKVDWPIDKYQLYYDEVTTEDEITTTEYKETDHVYSADDDSATISNIESKPVYEKYVRIVAIDNHLYAFSNAEFVKEVTIDGELEGPFGEEDVNVKIGNRSDVIYKFSVLKEMKLPYIKMEFNGSEYLRFSKLSAVLEKTTGTETEELMIRTVSEVNELNGITTLYVHLAGDNPVFTPEDNTEYTLTVTEAVVVNERKANEVYEGLKNLDETLKNWSLPYYIDDVTVSGEVLDKDMFIKFDAYWNVDDTESIDDDRQTSIELFNIDLDVKNKNRLPGSM